MKGNMVRVVADKHFGFVKPEDGSDDCHVSLPRGMNLQVGDTIEFEVEPARREGQKRSATNIRLISSAEATAPKAEGKSGPKTTASAHTTARSPKPPQIEVRAPLNADRNGSFTATVATRNKRGNLHEMNFRLVTLSPVAVTVRKVAMGQVAENEAGSRNFRTESTGYLELYIQFEGKQVKLGFILDDGQQATLNLVK